MRVRKGRVSFKDEEPVTTGEEIRDAEVGGVRVQVFLDLDKGRINIYVGMPYPETEYM